MPPTPGRQFQQVLAAREEHVSAGHGDVNPLGSTSFGTQAQIMAWRTRHQGDQSPQPIRGDNFGTFNFKQPSEFEQVKGYSGKPRQQ